ncbi:MAG: PAS domain S-box protein [Chloroflexota bacterium]|jgi:two-component system cell cycle sensor histidine kinase/response regulator CckA
MTRTGGDSDNDRGKATPTTSAGRPKETAGKTGRFLPRTIRGTLLLLLLVVLIPMLSVQASISFRWYESSQAKEYQTTLETARSAAAFFDAYVTDILHQEAIIGRSILQMRNDEAQITTFLSTLALESPSIRSLSWIDQRGVVVASTSQGAVGTDIEQEGYTQKILNGDGWTVSNISSGGSPESAAFSITRSVRGENDRAQGAVQAIVDGKEIADMLKSKITSVESITILDDQGKAVFHISAAPTEYQSQYQHFSEELVTRALSGAEVTEVRPSASDGKERIHGFSPIRSMGWVAGTSRLVDEALGPLIREMSVTGLAVLLVAILALIAALLVSSRITSSMSGLREHALALGRGELQSRAETGLFTELDEIASAFNRMAKGVWEREVKLAGFLEKLKDSNRKLEIDNAERKQVEHALRESEERFRAIFEKSAIGMILVDMAGRVLDSNQAVLDALGYSRDELSKINPIEITYPEDIEVSRVFLEELLGGKRDYYQVEKRYQKKDGQLMWGRVTASLVRDTGGLPQFCIIMVEDITARKRLEEQLLRANRLEAAGRIAGQVAHDFNNLLSPLVAYPELIKMQLPQDHPALPYCDAMMEAAERAVEINEDMMALGRRGHFDEQAVDLNKLVEQALGQLTPHPDTLEIQLRLNPELMAVNGSPAQLLRVITNLISNAREALDDSGRITIETDNIYVEELTGRYNRVEKGEYALLTVADTGPGIPMEIADKIFDAFFTTKQGSTKRRGAGLGLSIVQAIINDHRGYIDLKSEVGKGTAFTVFIPVSRQLISEKPNESVVGGTESVLIVDDDQSMQKVTGEQLRTLGYRVETVASGEEAVAFLKEHEVDLVILDMVMPTGIDGAESYRRIVEIRPGQKTIIVSGYSESVQLKDAQRLGVRTFLRKPLTLKRLAQAVRQELDS